MAQAPLAPGIETKVVTMRLVVPEAEALDQRAEVEGRTRSALIRDAVRAYLDQHDHHAPEALAS